MLLAEVVEASQQMAATTKRLAKIAIGSRLLGLARGREIDIAVQYLSGNTPGGRLGIGYATAAAIHAEPATEAKLTLVETDDILTALRTFKGQGSEGARREHLRNLFSRLTRQEADFLRRLLTEELRQGALEGIMLEAVASAAALPPAAIRRAAMLSGDLAQVAREALENGANGLARFRTELFRPVQPMLAGTAEDVAAALETHPDATLEYKFDGARVQAHKDGGTVRIYSRQLNDVTEAVPEITALIQQLPLTSAILDGEVLSFDSAGRPRPFQVTMRRFGRRLNVGAMQAELPVAPIWFDLLFADGQELIDAPQQERFKALQEAVEAVHLVPHLTPGSKDEAEEFTRDAIAGGHEGVMVKAKSAPYAAGARGESWLKVKRAHTLDLVILAAEWGSGRRHGFLSNLHLGARKHDGSFAMLGKTFKGLTDQMLAWQTEHLLKLEIGRDRWAVHVQPSLVVEIAFNDIQISPRYADGLALRFARVKRYRTDKSAADADSFETVQHMAKLQ